MSKTHVSDQDTLDAIERLGFHLDPFALKTLTFIEQQDRFGWSGAWEPAIERWTKQLRWYKELKARERETTRAARGHFAAMARKRWEKHTKPRLY